MSDKVTYEDLPEGIQKAIDKAEQKIRDAEAAPPPLFFKGRVNNQASYFPITGGYEIRIDGSTAIVRYDPVGDYDPDGIASLYTDGLTAEFLEERSVSKYQALQREAALQRSWLREKGLDHLVDIGP